MFSRSREVFGCLGNSDDLSGDFRRKSNTQCSLSVSEPMEFYMADFYHLTTSNNKNLPSVNQIHKLRIPSPLAKELDKHRPKAMEALEHARWLPVGQKDQERWQMASLKLYFHSHCKMGPAGKRLLSFWASPGPSTIELNHLVKTDPSLRTSTWWSLS